MRKNNFLEQLTLISGVYEQNGSLEAIYERLQSFLSRQGDHIFLKNALGLIIFKRKSYFPCIVFYKMLKMLTRIIYVVHVFLMFLFVPCRNDPEKFREDLMNIARTTLSSKILTQYKDHFAKLAVDAVLRLKVRFSDGTI